MDLAGKILSDTPFKEVNLLNELDHMEHSCGQTDASTSIAVPCLCQERVPDTDLLLLGADRACTDTGRLTLSASAAASAVTGDLPGKGSRIKTLQTAWKTWAEVEGVLLYFLLLC